MGSTEQKIIETAFQLAQQKPYDKITYSDIAEKAGVHRSTVQRYFGSKEKMRQMIQNQIAEVQSTLPDTKTKILNSARKIFAKYGFQGASLDLVAQEAGLTKGAVYWHFSSKNDLYLALCERSLKQLLQGLPEQVQAIFSSPQIEEKLKDFFAAQLMACEQQKGEQTLLFFEFITNSREPSVKEKLSQSFSALFDETSQILQDLQNKGWITSTIHPRDLAIALLSLVNGAVLMWFIAPSHVSLPSLADSMAQIVMNGIRST